jgi:hypothetical protein
VCTERQRGVTGPGHATEGRQARRGYTTRLDSHYQIVDFTTLSLRKMRKVKTLLNTRACAPTHRHATGPEGLQDLASKVGRALTQYNTAIFDLGVTLIFVGYSTREWRDHSSLELIPLLIPQSGCRSPLTRGATTAAAHSPKLAQGRAHTRQAMQCMRCGPREGLHVRLTVAEQDSRCCIIKSPLNTQRYVKEPPGSAAARAARGER